MIVSDTNTLRYLILIGSVQVLPAMYERIIIPAWVFDMELQDEKTPETVKAWIRNAPDWLEREAVRILDTSLNPGQLGRGEREAISLALQFRGEGVQVGLLTDDKAAA